MEAVIKFVSIGLLIPSSSSNSLLASNLNENDANDVLFLNYDFSIVCDSSPKLKRKKKPLFAVVNQFKSSKTSTRSLSPSSLDLQEINVKTIPEMKLKGIDQNLVCLNIKTTIRIYEPVDSIEVDFIRVLNFDLASFGKILKAIENSLQQDTNLNSIDKAELGLTKFFVEQMKDDSKNLRHYLIKLGRMKDCQKRRYQTELLPYATYLRDKKFLMFKRLMKAKDQLRSICMKINNNTRILTPLSSSSSSPKLSSTSSSSASSSSSTSSSSSSSSSSSALEEPADMLKSDRLASLELRNIWPLQSLIELDLNSRLKRLMNECNAKLSPETKDFLLAFKIPTSIAIDAETVLCKIETSIKQIVNHSNNKKNEFQNCIELLNNLRTNNENLETLLEEIIYYLDGNKNYSEVALKKKIKRLESIVNERSRLSQELIKFSK